MSRSLPNLTHIIDISIQFLYLNNVYFITIYPLSIYLTYTRIKLTIISTLKLCQNIQSSVTHHNRSKNQKSESRSMYHRCWSFTKRRALVNPRRACSNLVNEVSTDRRGRLSMHLILSRCLLHSSPRYRRIARKSSMLVEASFRLFASGESISFSRVCGMARLDLTNRPPSKSLFDFVSLALSVPLSFSLSYLYRIASGDESWPNRSGPIYLVRFSLQRVTTTRISRIFSDFFSTFLVPRILISFWYIFFFVI